MISQLRSLLFGSRPELYAVLDIGTAEAKSLVLLVDGEQAAIVGAGRQAYDPGAIAGGAVGDVALALQACDAALGQAEAGAEVAIGQKLVADHAIVGIAGPLLRSVCLALSIRRERPEQRIGRAELHSLVQRTQNVVAQHAQAAVGEEGASARFGVVDADVLRIAVDGYAVINAIGKTGATVDIRLSNVIAPEACLHALRDLVCRLDMYTRVIQAGVCALAHTRYLTARGDAVILDVGGECTDIALLRGGGVESVSSLPMGGAWFTREIVRTLGVPAPAAEEIKRSYARGQLDRQRSDELHAAFREGVQAWLAALQDRLAEMGGREELPAQFYLCGGGAALPDLISAMHRHHWARSLRFARQPQASVIHTRDINALADHTLQLDSASFVVPVALATWAVQALLNREADPAHVELRQVIHGMDLL